MCNGGIISKTAGGRIGGGSRLERSEGSRDFRIAPWCKAGQDRDLYVNKQILVELGSGAFVGEMAVLDAEPRSATITTMEDSVFYELSHDALVEAMANEVNVSLGIVRTLSRRLRETNIRHTTYINHPSKRQPEVG